MKFIDEAKVFIKSGDGGDGCLSFRREKYIEFGGPDGGNGGRGGNIYVQGVKGLNTLVDFRFQKHFRAKKGVHGAGRKRNGAAGKDIVLKLPLGTQIYEDDELIEDIVSIKKILLFEGGKGGLGNTNFKSSTNRAPRKITLGEKGYEADVVFKLKLIADTGLIGLPNAGKSSFMKKLTAAKTKVGDYPFTTIVPKLGVMRKGDSEKIIAEIENRNILLDLIKNQINTSSDDIPIIDLIPYKTTILIPPIYLSNIEMNAVNPYHLNLQNVVLKIERHQNTIDSFSLNYKKFMVIKKKIDNLFRKHDLNIN